MLPKCYSLTTGVRPPVGAKVKMSALILAAAVRFKQLRITLRNGIGLLVLLGGLGAAALRYRFRRPWQPRWVGEAVRRAEARYQVALSQVHDPAYNGFLAPIVQSYINEPRMSSFMHLWRRRYSSDGNLERVDHTALVASRDPKYQAAKCVMAERMPEVLAALRQPLFMVPPRTDFGVESSHDWFTAHSALCGYAEALVADSRLEEARELLEALLAWTDSGLRAPDSTGLIWMSALQRRTVQAWLGLFQPTLSDSSERLEQACANLRSCTLGPSPYLEYLENRLAENARLFASSEYHGFNERLGRFFGVHTYDEVRTQNGIAYRIEEEKPPYLDLQEPMLSAQDCRWYDSNIPSPKQWMAPQRKILQTLATTLSLLSHRVRHGEFPSELSAEDHIPNAVYRSDGQSMRLEVPCRGVHPLEGERLEAIYGCPEWFEYGYERYVVRWGDQ